MQQMQQQPCNAVVDASFGPWAGEACRGGFDFTLLFEETILAIPLQSIAVAVMAARIAYLSRAEVKVVPSSLRWVKLLLSVTSVSLSASLVALLQPMPWATKATTPAAVLGLVAALLFCVLSWQEHRKNLKPSFLIFAYLFLSVLLDIPRARTLWMLPISGYISQLFVAQVALRGAMLVIESIEKRHILLVRYFSVSAEATSGPLNRSVFAWLLPLFLAGYRKVLGLEDLHALDRKLRTAALYDKIRIRWAKVKNPAAFGALPCCCYFTFKMTFLSPVLPKLLDIALLYCQPFLINLAISIASEPETSLSRNSGYGLIGAYAIVYVGEAIAASQFEWQVYRGATVLRGSVISLIYAKVLRLDLQSDDHVAKGAITLMNTDCETILHILHSIHDAWGGILESCVGLFLLYRQLGAACALPITIVTVSTIATFCVAGAMGKASATWIQAAQDRVTCTSKILRDMKSLKLSGRHRAALDVVKELRAEELRVSTLFRKLLLLNMIFVLCVPIWVPILTFVTFAGLSAGSSSALTISKAFTSYSILVLVTKPLSDIIISIPLIATALASFQRIQTFLNAKELGQNEEDVPKDNLTSCSLEDTNQNRSSGVNADVELQEYVCKTSSAEMEGIAASVTGSVTSSASGKIILDVDKWEIHRGALNFLLGPANSGKSLLLKSLLGETAFKGTVKAIYEGVAFCDQEPWIPDATVKNVVCGNSPPDEPWYQTVIHSCALTKDIRDWPLGDQTMTGTNGTSISGGQKRRLALARALFSKKDLLLLDDIFIGLDSATEDEIFRKLFDEHGLLRDGKTTVVLVTSRVRHTKEVDYFALLNDSGSIAAQGKVSERDASQPTNLLDTSHDATPETDATGTREKREPDVTPPILAQGGADRRLGDSAAYRFYISAMPGYAVLIFFTSFAVFSFCSYFPSIWLKWWAEANAKHPNENLGKWLGVYVSLGVGAVGALSLAIKQVFINMISNSGIYFHDVLIETISLASMSFFANVDLGTNINRFSQDLELIDMELPAHAIAFVAGVFSSVTSFVVVAVSAKYLAAALPLIILASYAIQHFYLRTSRQLRLLDIEHKAPIYQHLLQTIDGLITIRAFEWESEFEKSNMELVDNSQRPTYLLYCVQQWLRLAVAIMVSLVAIILVTIITTLRHTIGTGFVGVALVNVMNFANAMRGVVSSFVDFEVALGAVSRIRAFAADTKRESDVASSSTDHLGSNWPRTGSLQFLNVSASYDGENLTLSEVSLSIASGEKIAICGRTGSGKSSLVLVLLRFIELQSGSVYLDGADLQSVPRTAILSNIVVLPQEPCILESSIKFNLDPTNERTKEELKDVLTRVGLWSIIDEQGGIYTNANKYNFSLGAAQLLMFARAMLRKGKVLVLDECTSGMDTAQKSVIEDLIHSWFSDWTVIAIVHDLSNALSYDKVAVISSGKLLEHDCPRKLLSHDSAFKKLFRSAEAAV